MDDERIETNQAEDLAAIDAEVDVETEGATKAADDAEPNLLERALRSAGSDAAKYLPVKFIPALTSLITVPIFTAAISPADYGAFFLISSVCSFASALAVTWLSSAAVRFYWPAKRENEMDAYTATVLWASVVSLVLTSVLAAVGAYLGAGSISANVLRMVPVGIAFFIMNYLTNTLISVLRAARRAGTFARLQVGGVLLTTALSIAFVWIGKTGAAGIFAGAALGWTIVLIPMLRAIAQEGSLSPRAISRPMADQFLRYGIPLIPAGISSVALVLIDRFVIQAFASATAVGLYSVAYSLGDKIMQLATAPLLFTMAPSLVETFEKRGQALAEKVQTQFVRYFALLTFPLILGMAAAAQPFMHVFTKQTYWSAWPVLAIVAVGSMLGSLSGIAGMGLGLHKKTMLIMVQTLIAAAFNLVMNVLLVPRFGYIAAAYNTVAAYFILVGLSWWQSRPYMQLRLPWAALGRIGLASIGMGLAIWLPFAGVIGTAGRPLSAAILTVQTLAGIGIYVLMLRLMKAVRPEELRFLGGLWRSALKRVRRVAS